MLQPNRPKVELHKKICQHISEHKSGHIKSEACTQACPHKWSVEADKDERDTRTCNTSDNVAKVEEVQHLEDCARHCAQEEWLVEGLYTCTITRLSPIHLK